MPGPVNARRVVRCGVVDSTQAIAFDLAERGAADGTAVVADAQTEGRGRRGRVWYAEPGTSLLVSIVLRPRLEPRSLPLLSFAAALSVAGTIQRLAGVAPRLKWPNDVLVGGRKIAGILLESRVSDSGAVVVTGIGLNLAQERFPAPVAETATSLVLETGCRIDREATLDVLLDEIHHWRARLEQDGFAPLRARWLALADTIGRKVAVDGVTGIALDLAMDGALLIDVGSSVRAVIAGDVREHTDSAVGTTGTVPGSARAGRGNRDAARR